MDFAYNTFDLTLGFHATLHSFQMLSNLLLVSFLPLRIVSTTTNTDLTLIWVSSFFVPKKEDFLRRCFLDSVETLLEMLSL